MRQADLLDADGLMVQWSQKNLPSIAGGCWRDHRIDDRAAERSSSTTGEHFPVWLRRWIADAAVRSRTAETWGLAAERGKEQSISKSQVAMGMEKTWPARVRSIKLFKGLLKRAYKPAETQALWGRGSRYC